MEILAAVTESAVNGGTPHHLPVGEQVRAARFAGSS